MEVVICDKGSMGIQAKNTYDSLKESSGRGFWFVLLPENEDAYLEAKKWALDEKYVVICNPKHNIGGYVDRNKVYSLFPKADWITRVSPGVIFTPDYFSYLNTHRNDTTLGAIGAIGYFIHGNWEGIDGNEVPPKHVAHVLDDCLWSWRVNSYRYEPPFNNICLGNYDHQFYIHKLGKNCLTAPSSCVQFIPEELTYDETLFDSVKFLSDKWSRELDFLKTSEITRI